MKDNASIHDNKTTSSGGGVALTDGTFTMQDNAKIYDNNSRGGGGVWVWGENASFIMTGSASVYNNNSNTSSSGGGVLVSRGAFTMQGNASVCNNTAAGSVGGGVSVTPSGNGFAVSFTMEGGEIYGNSSTFILDGRKGGGVYVDGDRGTASFRIVNGTICGSDETDTSRKNTVDSGGTGAALYVASSSNTTAQRGTFSGTGGAWVSAGTLSTSETTVKVLDGATVP